MVQTSQNLTRNSQTKRPNLNSNNSDQNTGWIQAGDLTDLFETNFWGKQRSFIKRQTSSTSSDNEWKRVVQRVTTNDNEWQRMRTSDNEWYNEWQRVTVSANFSFFQIREEASTKHSEENSLNVEEDLWRSPIELQALKKKYSPQEEILTVRRRNGRFSSR